ncbi:MAG: HigA family addiction module antidote protein [Spirochaetaceae bacterium]|jgi:addiction module HigA family antidote|nr:HigA family addiction module antidote protein [Spirochaetaceae bacterium]
MAKKTLVLPGDALKEKIKEYNIPISALSSDIRISVSAVRQITTNRGRISLHIARRLAKYFSDTTVEYWMNIQTAYDIAELDHDPEFTEAFKKIPKAKKIPAAPAKKAPEKPPKKDAKKRTPKTVTPPDDAPAKPARKPRTKKQPEKQEQTEA